MLEYHVYIIAIVYYIYIIILLHITLLYLLDAKIAEYYQNSCKN